MARKVTAGHMALRQSEHGSHETRTPPWELAALDADGNELYRTEYADSRDEAEQLAREADPSRHDGVDKFIPVETEE